MTGHTDNLVEQLVQQIQRGQHCNSKAPVRKIYIDEDPAKEETVPCPRCVLRNQQHMVRYVFLNLSVAIYKCEGPDCMYPFRNYKFKNFEENIVYRYQQQSDLKPLDPAYGAEYIDSFHKECTSGFDTVIDHIASVDFSLDFLSHDKAQQEQPGSMVVRGSTTQPLDCDSFAKSFDTGFIDDMLKDLFPSSDIPPAAPQTSPPASTEGEYTMPTNGSITPNSQTSGRKLEKCLKVFQKPNDDDVFKKPMVPEGDELVVEHITPTKLRIKKVFSPPAKAKGHRSKGGKHKKKKQNYFSLPIGTSSSIKLKQARALVKSKRIQPLELVCTLNTLSQHKTQKSLVASRRPAVPKSPDRSKVQNMLNFIQRSMKNRNVRENAIGVESMMPVVGDSNGSPNDKIKNAFDPGVYSTVASPNNLTSNFTEASPLEFNSSMSSPSGGMELFFQLLE
uniref:Uncharacterized protein n=1 Tax=Anopheles dirus TaxID=7168 RepID=A0A182NQ19_9DIPT